MSLLRLFKKNNYKIMKKNILISGSSGFLGQNLCNYLKKKYNLYLIINKKIPDIQGKNITAIKFKNYNNLLYKLKKIKIDYVIHAATFYSKEDNEKNIRKIINANILLGTYLLEFSKNFKIDKFINITTNWENYNGILENPKNFYAASKLAFSKICDYYLKKNKNTKFFSLYLSDTFGSNDKRIKLIPSIKKIINTRKQIKLASNNIYLNILNIEDVVEAINIVLGKKITPNKYSVINSKKIKLVDIINKLHSTGNFLNIKSSKMNVKIDEKLYKFKKIMNWKIKKSNLKSVINYLTN